jgi:hypothetical protein
MAITDSGNVGIGTSSPTARLHIAAGNGQRAIYLSGGATIISTSLSSKWNLPSTSSGNGTLSAITSNWDTGGGLGFIEGSNVSSPVAWMYAADDRNAFTVAAKGYSGTGQDMSTIDSYLTPLFQVRENGRVGIGTTNPQTSLDVNGSIRMGYDATLTQSSGKNILEDRSGYGDTLRIAYNGGSASFTSGVLIYGGQTTLGLAVKPNGRVGIGTSSPQQTLDVSGTVRSKVVQITGGSDLAEPFEIVGAENVKPGLVVAIDTEHSGQLRIADRTYDHTVVGCVSGANGVNPGLVMQQEGTVAGGQFPVALSGRVYCWADASYGPIQPGDLLTTSDTPGHLMVVGDYDRAHGAIVGKAMSGLEAGQGLILVLVALQ